MYAVVQEIVGHVELVDACVLQVRHALDAAVVQEELVYA
jgi:hypothetical protein